MYVNEEAELILNILHAVPARNAPMYLLGGTWYSMPRKL